MDAFKTLRREAAEKRDRAIANARQDFDETIVQIEELEKSLQEPVVFHRHKLPIVALIREVMPRDREFVLDELIGLMRAADTSRKYQKASVSAMLRRLCNEGEVTRTQKGGGSRAVKYIAAECVRPPYEFEGMSQVGIAELILREKGEPMTMTAIVVEMFERGFRTESDKRVVSHSIEACMRKAPTRFRKAGDKWCCT